MVPQEFRIYSSCIPLRNLMGQELFYCRSLEGGKHDDQAPDCKHNFETSGGIFHCPCMQGNLCGCYNTDHLCCASSQGFLRDIIF